MPESAIQVEAYLAADRDAWNAYVLSHPDGTVFHLRQWSEAVERAYGHRPRHLVARTGDRIVGVLPLVEIRSLFVGKVFVSVPYATYGGILADGPEIASQLLERARQQMNEAGANYIELRHREPSSLDLPVIGRYDTFRKRLPSQVPDVMENLPRKARAAARNGLSDLGESCTQIGPEGLGTIYDLYCRSLRRLGSPNYSRTFFEQLAETYGPDCVCLVVREGEKPIAGVVSFLFRDEIVPYFSGCTERGMRCNANNVMYLRLMEYAVGRGIAWFDFNRTRRDNTGPYKFKEHQGFEPTPLHYQIALAAGAEMPNLTPSNRKFALAGRIWQKLPLGVTRAAGSVVSRWIP